MPVLAVNKQARFDYEILESYEAGLVLRGYEVKAVRAGQMNLKGAFCSFAKGELYLTNAHISKYKYSDLKEYDLERPRKLLITTKEMAKLQGKLQQQGLTLVPLKVYTKGKHIKVEFGLAKGKKKADKRETLKKRAIEKDIRQSLKYR